MQHSFLNFNTLFFSVLAISNEGIFGFQKKMKHKNWGLITQSKTVINQDFEKGNLHDITGHVKLRNLVIHNLKQFITNCWSILCNNLPVKKNF